MEFFQNQNSLLVPEPNSVMKKGFPLNTTVFFMLIFLYHILMSFQGLDMLDEGFHVTFYQQFFNDPESVQYSFFYWFSGLVGGGILKLFPSSGLWGIRVAGAVSSTVTIWLAFQMLKEYINIRVLMISLSVLVIFINTEPRDLYYNNLSALLYFTGAFFMFNGLKKNKGIYVLLAGAILCINIFTRTPNLLGLGLVVLIFYHAWLYPETKKYFWRKFFLFVVGAITGLLLVIFIMHLLGHLEYFVNSIKYLSTMSSTTDKKDGLGGGYGLIKMIYIPIKQYSMAIGSVLLILSFLLTGSYLLTAIKPKNKWLQQVLNLVPFLFLLALCGLIATDKIKINMLLYFLTGISLFFGILTILRSASKELRLLSALGCIIILIHPFGSAPGIITVVIYSMWISFPIAAAHISKISAIQNKLNFSIGGEEGVASISLTGRQLNNIRLGTLTIILYLCIHHIFTYPYFYDYHKRSEMTWQVENKNMRHIYTSKERAGSINELLTESAKYVREKDYVLAYDAIPLYHFMTETRPFLNNPSPMFYSTGLFANEMEKATEKRPLPVIIKQKIKTVHEGSRWPEEIVQYNEEDIERSAGRNLYLESFIEKHGYKEVWSNKVFSISIPGVGH